MSEAQHDLRLARVARVAIRLGIALLYSLPGLTIALLAKPLILGDAALMGGLLFAFVAPLIWLMVPRRP